MLTLVFACLFFLVAQSGHIYPQDIIMSPNNKNTASEITIIFTPETTITSTDYLRVVFPFRLNALQSGSWDTYTNCVITSPGKLAISTPSTLPSDGTSYFVSFYSDLTTNTRSGLTGNVTYYVKIIGTPDPASTTGINLPVQVYTVSNTKGGWVAYDSNTAFGTLSLADSFPTTMIVFVAIPSTETNYNILGATYKVNIDITPTVTINARARIDIELTNSDFNLVAAGSPAVICQSISSTAEKIPALPATFEALAAHRVRATISQTLTAGSGAKYRFQCSVKNPALPSTTKITVKNRMGYIETITEAGTDSTGLQAATIANPSSSTGWDETAHKVLLGWGYEASSPTALNIFGLYKDASTTERWYQSTKTIFKPKAALSSTQKLQVIISTVDDAGFKILTASIFHNLPDYSATEKVTCSVINQGYLTCQNVGNLLASSYFVSFRFNLLSTTAVTTVSDFGKVSVQTMATLPVALIPLSLTTLTYKTIRSNVALFTTSGANGVVAYSTTISGSTTTTYVTNGEDVILKFAFKYFTNTVIPLVQASSGNIERGIEFYTSNALASAATTPSCSIGTLTDPTHVSITDCSVTQFNTQVYTRLRFRIASFAVVTSGSAPYNLFQATPQEGTISFNKVQFTSSQFSSLNYVNENVFDYYTRWVQDFTAANPTIVTVSGSSPFFFNSLVYKNGALSTLNVGTTFFVTGANAATPGNDGTDFPSLIRVTGVLSGAELTSANRILVFFNDLDPLNVNNPCFGSVAVTCKYNANGADNTQTNSLTDYSGSRRIEIDIGSATKFNVYIPVKTNPQKTVLGFFVATATTVSTQASAQGIFATQYTKRINYYTSSAPTQTIATASGTTPQLVVSGLPTMGTLIDTSIQNTDSTYIASNSNSGSNVGAAYAYCGNYDFTTGVGFALKTYYSSSATLEQACVTLKYNPSTSKEVTCNVCPLHTTMSTGSYAVTQFTLPTMAGKDFYNFVFVVGNNNGDFKAAAYNYKANALTPFYLTGLSITFTPTDFKKDSKNVLARLSFTTVSVLPKSIRIDITPSGSSLMIVPAATTCTVNTLATTSCALSGTTTDIQIDTVAQGSSWPVGTHTIDFMVDASGASAITSDTSVGFKVTIKVDSATALSAIHHDSTAQTFTIKSTALLEMGLYNISYVVSNKDARTLTTFTFAIPSDILVYPAQKVVLNLGGLATANAGQVPICRVLDPATLQTSNAFASCDTTDLTQVSLQPKAPLTGNYTIELHYIKVPSSAAPTGITAKVVAVDGTTTVAQSPPATPLALPSAIDSYSIPTLNVNFNRHYSDPGEVAEIILDLKPYNKSIEMGTYLYIYFPTYYSDKLGYQNIWCTADDLPISCFVIAPRLMQLTSFPVTVARNQNVQIKIYGVVTPVVPVPPGKVFIALANQTTPYILVEQIEVSDKASNSLLPTALAVTSYTVTTTKIRDKSDHTLIFTTSATGISSNKIISIDFPDRFGGTLRGQEGPKINIFKTGDTVVTEVQSVSFGSRFKIILPLSLDPSTSYTIVIKDIDNPEQPVCSMDKPMIIVTDSNENAASFRSAPNIWDIPPISYISDTSLKSLTWTDKTGSALSSLTVVIGIFSPEIRIYPPAGENFNQDISFTTSQTELSLLPGVLKAVRGRSYLSLKVAASSSSFPSIVLLDLNKDESYTNNVYAQVPKLQLNLVNSAQTLPTPSIRIMAGGTSLPYRWELDTLNLIPHTELKISVTVNSAATSSLSIVGPSTITFGPSSPQQGFSFSLAVAASAITPPSFVLALSGQDAKNYVFANNTIVVTVISAINTAATLTQVTTTANYASTKQQFILKADQMASVFWHVAYEDKLSTTDCLRVRAKYSEGKLYDANSANQAQYGVFYLNTENVATTFEIGNLIANMRYSYILCPVNQMDIMGTATTNVFQTKDNQATMSQLTLTFSQNINRNQLASILCVFAQELQLPNQNVVALDGTTCSTPSVFDDFSTFNYGTITVFVHGDRGTETTSTTVATLTQYVNSVTTQTASNFLTLFNQALQGAGIKNYFQSITMQTGPSYPLPVLNTGAIKTTTAPKNITVSGLALSSGSGVIYAVATDDLVNVPTSAQIKNKLSAAGTTTSAANALYDSAPITMTFTNLKPNTEYMIYYYASNADRTQYARVTDTAYINTKTDALVEVKGALRVSVSLLLVLLSVVAWLL